MRSSPTRIAFFDQYPFIGGGQMVLFALIRSAIRANQMPTVAVPAGGALEKELNRRYGETIEIVQTEELIAKHGKKSILDALRFGTFSLGFVIRHYSRFKRADIVYGNGPRQFLGIMLLSLICRRVVFYHVHIDHSRAEKFLIALAAKLSSTYKVVLNSEFIRKRLIEAVPSLALAEKLVVVENGLDCSYESRVFVDRFTEKVERWNVVVVGVIRPEKGQDLALDLAKRIKEIHVHVLGRIGEGAEEWAKHLKKSATNNVTFHDAVNDVPATLDRLNAHFNLVPSQWEEPFGLSAIEGMACSCITLVSHSGALADIARKTGAIVFGSDIESLEKSFLEVMSLGHNALSTLANRQFKSTIREYGPERFTKTMAELLANARGNQTNP